MFELPPHSKFRRRRGPELTYIADKLTRDNLVIRIVNGGTNMPAFGSSLKPGNSMTWLLSWKHASV